MLDKSNFEQCSNGFQLHLINGKMWTCCQCVNTSHTSLHHFMPVTPETHWSRSSGLPSMTVQQVMTNLIPLKWSTIRYNQTWENTAIKWNIDIVRETKSNTWSGLKNRWSRKPDEILTYISWISWTSMQCFYTYVKPQKMDGSRLPMYSM